MAHEPGVLALLRKSDHARIVNVSSGAGSHGEPQFGLTSSATVASYGVSKAALNALTVKLAGELKEQHILVNAVDPGLTATAPGMEEMGRGPYLKARPASSGRRALAKTDPRAAFTETANRCPGKG